MKSLPELLRHLINNKGGNASDVAKKLGISPARLRYYTIDEGKKDHRKPKQDFFDKWREVFGEDLQQMLKGTATNVSRETLYTKEEVAQETFWRKMMEDPHHPYKAMPREFFEHYKFVPDKLFDRINQTNDELKQALVDKYERYIQILEKELAECKSRLGPG